MAGFFQQNSGVPLQPQQPSFAGFFGTPAGASQPLQRPVTTQEASQAIANAFGGPPAPAQTVQRAPAAQAAQQEKRYGGNIEQIIQKNIDDIRKKRTPKY